MLKWIAVRMNRMYCTKKLYRDIPSRWIAIAVKSMDAAICLQDEDLCLQGRCWRLALILHEYKGPHAWLSTIAVQGAHTGIFLYNEGISLYKEGVQWFTFRMNRYCCTESVYSNIPSWAQWELGYTYINWSMTFYTLIITWGYAGYEGK